MRPPLESRSIAQIITELLGRTDWAEHDEATVSIQAVQRENQLGLQRGCFLHAQKHTLKLFGNFGAKKDERRSLVSWKNR